MIFDIGWITDELFDSNSGNVAGSAQVLILLNLS
jgi:hypothetical protein